MGLRPHESRRYALMLLAARSAVNADYGYDSLDELLRQEDPSTVKESYSHDEKNLRGVSKELKVKPREYCGWREGLLSEVTQIVALPHVLGAIRSVAMQLATIPAGWDIQGPADMLEECKRNA
jgi:hypothetical protein